MQEIMKQNSLLKEYISSLQKENEARNIERNTLFSEIQRMSAEIDRLNNIISKHNSKNISHSNQAERQMKTIKETNANLLKEMQIMKSKNSQISLELKSKQLLISTLSQEKQSLISQVMVLKELELQITQQRQKSVNLQKQISNYKANIFKNSNYQERNNTLNLKIRQLQQKLKFLEDNSKKQLNTYSDNINRLQLENEQLKLNNKASIEISNLLSSKINLQATVKRLNSKIQWLQSNNHEHQKQVLQVKIRNIQEELSQAQHFIEQLRNNQLQYQNLQASKSSKEKQILTLESVIESLKIEIKQLEEGLKEKQQIISHLQEEVYRLTNLNQNQHHLQADNHQLQLIKSQLEKQISLLTQTNNTLKDQSVKLNQKQKSYISEISSLRQERERLLRQLDNQSYSLDQAQNQIKLYKSKVTQYNINRHQSQYRIAERDHNNRPNDDENLRFIVSRLQGQIQELKASQFKSQLFQDNIYNNYQSQNIINIKSQLSQISRQNRSPTGGVAINISSDKNDNKRKWQNLQRKITVLRSQNETLKKTLFD